jgi:hypothetical protein
MKFMIAGSDFIDCLQSHWLCYASKSFLTFIRRLCVRLSMEESTDIIRILVSQLIYRTQLININHLADPSPEFVKSEISRRWIFSVQGVQ